MTHSTYPANARSVDFSSRCINEAKVLQNNFGDGYVQRAADGLNNVRPSWEVSWTNLTVSEKDLIESFLISQGGWKSFWWTAPGAYEKKKWTCQKWTFTPVAGGYWSGTASFVISFDP